MWEHAAVGLQGENPGDPEERVWLQEGRGLG